MAKKQRIVDRARHELRRERERFCAGLSPDIAKHWQPYPGRIGVVLSGGGARGAYEAGVLMAFQDAQMPTHILTATSVGSINAASYAGHSDTVVGKADSLVHSWSELTPATVGIDWFRYILVLTGLIAASVGFGNLLRSWINESGFRTPLVHPKLTWFALALTGLALLYFYDQASYLWYVFKNWYTDRRWEPDKAKLSRSIFALTIILVCSVFLLSVTRIHMPDREVLDETHSSFYFIPAALALAAVLGYFQRDRISVWSRTFLRTPLRSGLFPNFERTRFLRGHIPAEGLRKSPIRVVMTSTDVTEGKEKYFTNFTPEEVANDPGADPAFLKLETEPAVDDLLLAVIASSAFPIVYETVPLHGRMWTDGGIVGNQPIKPAVRLGADAIFLVMVEPRSQKRGETKTFLDLGVRAIDVLMAQNLRTDLALLGQTNGLCGQYAREMGLRPEQVRLRVGEREFRFIKAIQVEPHEPLAAGVLDFDGEITAPAILQGYKDGCAAVMHFKEYVDELPQGLAKHDIKLVAEEFTEKKETGVMRL